MSEIIDDRKAMDQKLIKWASEHMPEWEIICGIKTTGIYTNQRILAMIRQEGFEELSNMMASRIHQYFYDEAPAEMTLKENQ